MGDKSVLIHPVLLNVQVTLEVIVKIMLFFLIFKKDLFIYFRASKQVEGQREERMSSRLRAERRARCEARSHNPRS